MKIFGEKNGVTSYFSHMSPRAVKVCILINPFAQPKVYHSYANESGRKVLLTITLNGQEMDKTITVQYLLYAPNDQVIQLQFIIIYKLELT